MARVMLTTWVVVPPRSSVTVTVKASLPNQLGSVGVKVQAPVVGIDGSRTVGGRGGDRKVRCIREAVDIGGSQGARYRITFVSAKADVTGDHRRIIDIGQGDVDHLGGRATQIIGHRDGKGIRAKPVGVCRGEGPGAGLGIDGSRTVGGRGGDRKVRCIREAVDIGGTQGARYRITFVSAKADITGDHGRIIDVGQGDVDHLGRRAAQIVGHRDGKGIRCQTSWDRSA